MKNLILIIGETPFQFDNPDELYNEILGKVDEDYRDLSSEEKAKRRYEKALLNTKGVATRIAKLSESSSEELLHELNTKDASKFYIDSDETYLLSLLNMNIAHLLESKNSNFFSSTIDKSSIADNYILLNHFVPQLLKRQQTLLKGSQKEEPEKIL